MHFIYKIVNFANDKIYIGQTNNLVRRWYEHKNGASNKPRQIIEEAMKKYGIEIFSYEILETCETQEEANEREQFYIRNYNSLSPNGYNIEKGGKQAPLSETSLQKISLALKGRVSHNKGKACSEEQKIKTSITMTGRKYSKERRENISKSLLGNIPWNKGKTKLSFTEIDAIKNDSRKYKEIALQYDISLSTISKIKNS